MNKTVIVGNLTRDPVVRTAGDKQVCAFTVAVNRPYLNSKGEREADFFDVSAWGKIGENCAKYLRKSSKVAVSGEVSARAYAAQDGTPRVSLQLQAGEVEFLTRRGDADDAGAAGAPKDAQTGFEVAEDSDLPF